MSSIVAYTSVKELNKAIKANLDIGNDVIVFNNVNMPLMISKTLIGYMHETDGLIYKSVIDTIKVQVWTDAIKITVNEKQDSEKSYLILMDILYPVAYVKFVPSEQE